MKNFTFVVIVLGFIFVSPTLLRNSTQVYFIAKSAVGVDMEMELTGVGNRLLTRIGRVGDASYHCEAQPVRNAMAYA